MYLIHIQTIAVPFNHIPGIGTDTVRILINDALLEAIADVNRVFAGRSTTLQMYGYS